MKRYIVTIADTDPTLAAQAHAAIVAVPGVVCVVAVPGYAEDALLDAMHEAEVEAGPAGRDFERVWTPFDPPDADGGWTRTDGPLFQLEAEPTHDAATAEAVVEHLARRTWPARRTGEIELPTDGLGALRERLRYFTPPATMRDSIRMRFDGVGWYVTDAHYDVARGMCGLRLLEELPEDSEIDGSPPTTGRPLTYTVGDEEDGDP